MRIEKVGAEWCAFAPSGREVARSTDKAVLLGYLSDTPQPDTPETDMPTIAKFSYRTRSRATGAAMATGRAVDKGWHAVCVSHGHSTPADSGSAAEKLLQKAAEWCVQCAVIAQGNAPKVAKNPELDELL